MIKLDEKDCIILNMLQADCRKSLTGIAKKVKLSVDSTKKRIIKMKENNIFFPKIQLRPRNFGFNNIVDIKIKAHNYSDSDIREFIDYLKGHPNVAEVMSVSGEWDFSIVVIARDGMDLGNITRAIRNKFSKIINDWSESLTTCVYKFEDYDMLKVMGHK
ncbi:Lrp/AsnC family transcriptional regulator [Candidatus Woesearchaeota archaeon]|nr:Lrp/AsnC family transcriptional regulator [Candidatus Woesearchaeota archaeon]